MRPVHCDSCHLAASPQALPAARPPSQRPPLRWPLLREPRDRVRGRNFSAWGGGEGCCTPGCSLRPMAPIQTFILKSRGGNGW